MSPRPSIKGRRRDQASEPVSNFERAVQWACLSAAQARGNAACVDKHRQLLRAKGETEERLREATDWRSSMKFTEREKAALSLGESISLDESRGSSRDVLEQARRYFDTSELVRLTMAVTSVNDWINLHSSSDMRALVVEDDPMDQELLRLQLKKTELAGRITFVHDGLKACELLTGVGGEEFRQKLAAIFLDVHLPSMSGIDLLRTIRTLPDMIDFPVIVMTSSNNPSDLAECRRLKATFVSKPVTASSFLNAIADTFPKVPV